jgi:hypothetical protein
VAEYFNVPIEQVAEKRVDVEAAPGQNRLPTPG